MSYPAAREPQETPSKEQAAMYEGHTLVIRRKFDPRASEWTREYLI